MDTPTVPTTNISSVAVQTTPPTPILTEPTTTLPPTTTIQEDVTTAGQRRINLIWEITQAFVATAITSAVIYNAIKGIASQELSNGFFLIIGFYFSRTNHQAIGGIGAQPQQPYQGR